MCNRTLSAHINKAAEIKAQLDALQRAYNEEKDFISNALQASGETKAATTAGHIAVISRRTRGDGFDAKRFKTDYSDLYTSYCTKPITEYYAFSVK